MSAFALPEPEFVPCHLCGKDAFGKYCAECEEYIKIFRAHGAAGGRLGGMKSSENMTAEQRTARAKKAVAARKASPVLSDEERVRRAQATRPVGRPRKAL